jgi:hypothetical protein
MTSWAIIDDDWIGFDTSTWAGTKTVMKQP